MITVFAMHHLVIFREIKRKINIGSLTHPFIKSVRLILQRSTVHEIPTCIFDKNVIPFNIFNTFIKKTTFETNMTCKYSFMYIIHMYQLVSFNITTHKSNAHDHAYLFH